MVRVLVVDDFPPYLAAAHQLVATTPGFEPSAELASGREALAALDEDQPDLVLVDVHMAEMDGTEFTRILRSRGSSAVVVLITAEDLDQLPAASWTCGAETVISKADLDPSLLRDLWERYGPRHVPA